MNTTTIKKINKLVADGKIENPNDLKSIQSAFKYMAQHGEHCDESFINSTTKWFDAVIKRGGKRFKLEDQPVSQKSDSKVTKKLQK